MFAVQPWNIEIELSEGKKNVSQALNYIIQRHQRGAEFGFKPEWISVSLFGSDHKHLKMDKPSGYLIPLLFHIWAERRGNHSCQSCNDRHKQLINKVTCVRNLTGILKLAGRGISCNKNKEIQVQRNLISLGEGGVHLGQISSPSQGQTTKHTHWDTI